MGNRVPADIKDQFRDVIDGSIMIPSLAHYVKYDVACLKTSNADQVVGS